MDSNNNTSQNRFFSQQATAIPFGKYESGSEDTFPCNESLVGREGARAKLIDFLINGGTRKAILVTGRRGMGKTSFVNYCIKEYQQSQIERFWRGDQGKSIFAFFGFVAISIFVTFLYFATGQGLDIISSHPSENFNPVYLGFIIFLIVLLCAPLYLSFYILNKIIKTFPPKSSAISQAFSAAILLLIFLLSVLVANKLNYHAINKLFSIALLIIYFSWSTIKRHKISGNSKSIKVALLFYQALPITIMLFIFSSDKLFIVMKMLLIKELNSINGIPDFLSDELFIAMASFLIIASTLINGTSLFSIKKFDNVKKAAKTNKAIDASIRRYLLISCVFILVACKYAYIIDEAKCILIALLLVIFFFTGLFFYSEPKENANNNQEKGWITVLFMLKAFLFSLLSAVYLLPFFSKYLSFINASEFSLFVDFRLIALISFNFILIFWIEYEWIIRPGRFYRRDASTYTGKRPSYYGDTGVLDDSINAITPHSNTDPRDIRKDIQNALEKNLVNHASERECNRIFEKLTFFDYFNRLYQATIISTINLGYEELNYSSVIYAMLLDIRDKYYSKFVSINKARGLLHFLLKIVGILVVSASLSRNYFSAPNKPINSSANDSGHCESPSCNKLDTSRIFAKFVVSGQLQNTQSSQGDAIVSEYKKDIFVKKYCLKSQTGYNDLPAVPKLLCELGGIYSDFILPIIYFEIFSIKANDNPERQQMVGWLFNIDKTNYPYSSQTTNTSSVKEIKLFLYHIILILSLYFFLIRLNKIFHLIPYRDNLTKIDELLDELTSSTITNKSKNPLKIFKTISSVSGDLQVEGKSISQTALDPRFVELKFMGILESISHSRPFYYFPFQSRSNSKSLEITFIFDELDKLATDINSQQLKGNPDGNDSELYRLHLMKGLLSNMKRIITCAEARFIFLGGRLLHDDWLADGARRQPLLTSIFSEEIYLPSLLVDANIDWHKTDSEIHREDQSESKYMAGTHSLNSRIEEYFVGQYYLSRKRFENWAIQTWAPVTGIPLRDERERVFIQTSYLRLKSLLNKKEREYKSEDITPYQLSYFKPLGTIPIRFTCDGECLDDPTDIHNKPREHARLDALIKFFAYRSVGNPKRLNELLSSFIMSADRAVPNSDARDKGFNCQDVLYLPDHKIMRIQLVARIYQHICNGFQEKIRGRDDKTIVSLIYLSDFLFKFHDRAFSWESLELIDELVHMHRGHDLRLLLQELIDHFSGRYLHRIINGMYRYRFRSYVTNEVEYLSRHSDEEMAAFNFTLDEAQSLRDHLQRLSEQGEDRNNIDILNMLGELHEFYQEYELARTYFRRCINARFPMLKEVVGEKVGKKLDEMVVLQAIYSNTAEGRNALRSLEEWGPATLRLFLRIVMTYEREHNFHDAIIRYERCLSFAEAMIQAFTSSDTNIDRTRLYESSPTADNLCSLEYLGLLFEPLFAYAWLLEKNSYTSSQSLPLIERGIGNFEKILNTVNGSNPKIGFVSTQWYKKKGTLCFFKGLNNVNGEKYLEKAMIAYLQCATDLSIYFTTHIKTQTPSLVANTENDWKTTTLINKQPTDYHLCVAKCLGDIADTIFAKLCPLQLFQNKNKELTNCDDKLLDFLNDVFGGQGFINEYKEAKDTDYKIRVTTLLKNLDNYFFDSTKSYQTTKSTTQESMSSALTCELKFNLAIDLSYASSLYLFKAGHVESAAREAAHTAEAIAQYLNWFWVIRKILGKEMKVESLIKETNKLEWYIDYLNHLFELVRSKPDHKMLPYLIGDVIPTSALTSICSVGLSLSLFNSDPYFEDLGQINNIINILKCSIDKWTGVKQNDDSTQDAYIFFRDKLVKSLQRHRYPVLNQLNALKTLTDATILKLLGSNSHDKKDKDEDINNINAWLRELYYINEKYNHPFHFTPAQMGISLFLYSFIPKKDWSMPNIEEFNVKTAARRRLEQSIDMCFQGRNYYSAVKGMYYLYDDFNDSQIHRNQALQMAGTNLTAELILKIDKAPANE